MEYQESGEMFTNFCQLGGARERSLIESQSEEHNYVVYILYLNVLLFVRNKGVFTMEKYYNSSQSRPLYRQRKQIIIYTSPINPEERKESTRLNFGSSISFRFRNITSMLSFPQIEAMQMTCIALYMYVFGLVF